MENLVNIRLHGELGKEIGKNWNLSVSSIGQAIHGIEILSKRKLYKFLLNKNNDGIQYKILVNKRELKFNDFKNVESVNNSELIIHKSNLKTIDIVPVIEGAGDAIADIFTTILGVVLVVAGIIVSGGLGAALIVSGIGLTAAGVSSMLTKAPTFEPFQEFETGGRPSYLFSGPYNTTREGGPVPVVYGEAIVGSQAVAANYKIIYGASKSGLATASLKGDLDPDFKGEQQRIYSNASAMANINPVLDFDFHPEDDELIMAYLETSQGSGLADYITNQIHILKYKDYSYKQNNRVDTRTHFLPIGEPFGDTRSGGYSIRDRYKYPILKRHPSLGKCIVSSICSDRINNKVFVGGIFEHNLAINDTTPKISLHGGGTSTIKNFMCIHADGKVSNTDSHGTAFTHPQPNGAVKAIAVESSGKIIIGGEFTEVAGTARNKVARLNIDGTLDTFNPNSTQHINSIITATVDGTEYIFIAGNGGYIKKYNVNGTEDTTFAGNLPNFGSAHIWALEIFNGNLVIAGNFSFDVNSITYQCLCRVNKDTGELDPDFSFSFQNSTMGVQHMKPINYDLGSSSVDKYGYPRTTHNPTVRTLTSDSNGLMLIVGGYFDSVNNNEEITTRNIFAVKEDGSIDKSFNPKPISNESGPVGHIQKAKLRKNLPNSDGKIYIGGSFTNYNSKSYTPEEIEVLSGRTVLTPVNRSVYNIARLYGKS